MQITANTNPFTTDFSEWKDARETQASPASENLLGLMDMAGEFKPLTGEALDQMFSLANQPAHEDPVIEFTTGDGVPDFQLNLEDNPLIVDLRDAFPNIADQPVPSNPMIEFTAGDGAADIKLHFKGNQVILDMRDASPNLTDQPAQSTPVIESTESETAPNAGTGDDLISVKGGSGRVSGDAGNDKMITMDGAYKMLGGGGDDVMMNVALYQASGTSSFKTTLHGGKGDDTLISAGGNNTVKGGAGDDMIIVELTPDAARNTIKLSGGKGEDTFVFYTEREAVRDKVVVRDFNTEQDKMMLDASGDSFLFEDHFTGWDTSELQFSYFQEHAVQKKNGVVLTTETGNKIVFKGLDMDAITVDHFVDETEIPTMQDLGLFI